MLAKAEAAIEAHGGLVGDRDVEDLDVLGVSHAHAGIVVLDLHSDVCGDVGGTIREEALEAPAALLVEDGPLTNGARVCLQFRFAYLE